MAIDWIMKSIELGMAKKIDAVSTSPIHKGAIKLVGIKEPGHTEIYQNQTNSPYALTMFSCHKLRVFFVSRHMSLVDACHYASKEVILENVINIDKELRKIGIENPLIAVAGLNPHNGDNGLFGTEEIAEIQPAIEAAMAEGICIPEQKPTPPDSIFSKAIGGWYDIVVAMYHDQGHIPLKVKGFVYNQNLRKWDAVAGVNITLGIPIIRVSVDHGTGFDLAGKGESNELSLVNAIDYAIRLAAKKT